MSVTELVPAVVAAIAALNVTASIAVVIATARNN